MAVNRYDTPAQAQFKNTYVPIPFEQLYTMGREATKRYDDTLKMLDTNMQKWSQFQSPSKIDMQRFKEQTFDKVKPVIDQLGSNPDLLKTAEGRAMIQGAIANIDYSGLAQLRQGAKSLEVYQANRAKMQAEGTLNPNWSTLDVSNYDTLNQGVLNDLAPVRYKSAAEMILPFTQKVDKNQFLGYSKDGRYQVVGTPESQINAIIAESRGALANTAQGQKYMEQFQREFASNPSLQAQYAGIPNGAEAYAQDAFNEMLYGAARQQLGSRIVADQYGMMDYRMKAEEAAAERKRKAKMAQQQGVLTGLDYTWGTARQQLKANVENAKIGLATSKNPAISNTYEKWVKDDTKLKNDAEAYQREVKQKVDSVKAMLTSGQIVLDENGQAKPIGDNAASAERANELLNEVNTLVKTKGADLDKKRIESTRDIVGAVFEQASGVPFENLIGKTVVDKKTGEQKYIPAKGIDLDNVSLKNIRDGVWNAMNVSDIEGGQSIKEGLMASIMSKEAYDIFSKTNFQNMPMSGLQLFTGEQMFRQMQGIGDDRIEGLDKLTDKRIEYVDSEGKQTSWPQEMPEYSYGAITRQKYLPEPGKKKGGKFKETYVPRDKGSKWWDEYSQAVQTKFNRDARTGALRNYTITPTNSYKIVPDGHGNEDYYVKVNVKMDIKDFREQVGDSRWKFNRMFEREDMDEMLERYGGHVSNAGIFSWQTGEVNMPMYVRIKGTPDTIDRFNRAYIREQGVGQKSASIEGASQRNIGGQYGY